MGNDKVLNVVLQPWLECQFHSKMDVPTFVDFDPLLGGLASMNINSIEATAIIEVYFYTSMEGSLNT